MPHVCHRVLLELANSLEFCNFWISQEGSDVSQAAQVALFGRPNTDEHAHLRADAAQQQATFKGIMLFMPTSRHSWLTREHGC